jgi:hypothetical protein
MEERGDSESKLATVAGFIGLAFAVLGMGDMPIGPQLLCLLAGSVCLPISFHSQTEWPSWVRWILSLAANSFLAYVAWTAIRKR